MDTDSSFQELGTNSAAVQKHKKEVKEEEEEEEEEDTELGEEEMMEWALRTLERTQYLSNSESDEEELTSVLPTKSSRSSGDAPNTQVPQASTSHQESSKAKPSGVTARLTVNPPLSTTGAEHNDMSASLSSATYEEPRTDLFALPVKEEEQTCDCDCVKEKQVSSDCLEQPQTSTGAFPCETQSSCLQRQAVSRDLSVDVLESGTNASLGSRECASFSHAATSSVPFSGQQPAVSVKAKPHTSSCSASSMYKTPMEVMHAQHKDAGPTSRQFKEEGGDDIVMSDALSHLQTAEVIPSETQLSVMQQPVVKTEPPTNEQNLEFLQSLAEVGSSWSSGITSSLTHARLKQQSVHQKANMKTTVSLVCDIGRAMDAGTVHQNNTANELTSIHDPSSVIPSSCSHPVAEQPTTLSFCAPRMREFGFKFFDRPITSQTGSSSMGADVQHFSNPNLVLIENSHAKDAQNFSNGSNTVLSETSSMPTGSILRDRLLLPVSWSSNCLNSKQSEKSDTCGAESSNKPSQISFNVPYVENAMCQGSVLRQSKNPTTSVTTTADSLHPLLDIQNGLLIPTTVTPRNSICSNTITTLSNTSNGGILNPQLSVTNTTQTQNSEVCISTQASACETVGFNSGCAELSTQRSQRNTAAGNAAENQFFNFYPVSYGVAQSVPQGHVSHGLLHGVSRGIPHNVSCSGLHGVSYGLSHSVPHSVTTVIPHDSLTVRDPGRETLFKVPPLNSSISAPQGNSIHSNDIPVTHKNNSHNSNLPIFQGNSGPCGYPSHNSGSLNLIFRNESENTPYDTYQPCRPGGFPPRTVSNESSVVSAPLQQTLPGPFPQQCHADESPEQSNSHPLKPQHPAKLVPVSGCKVRNERVVPGWVCSVCDKIFSSHWTLKAHMKTHFITRSESSVNDTTNDMKVMVSCHPNRSDATSDHTNERGHLCVESISATIGAPSTAQQQQTLSKGPVNVSGGPLQPPASLQCSREISEQSAAFPVNGRLKKKHGSRNEKCFKCHQTLATVEEALEHNKRHFQLRKVGSQGADDCAENQAPSCDKMEDVEYLCTICEEPLGFGGDIVDHIISHWPYKCQRCEKRYLQKTHLKKHDIYCTGDKPPCVLCNSKLRTIAKLPDHILLHIQNICPICKRVCTELSQLKCHLIYHFAIRSYFCKLCEGSFAYKSSLDEHTKRVHLKIPYCCKRCNKKFPVSRRFHAHIRICKEENQIIKDKKDDNVTFECDKCKNTYREKYHLRIHIQRVCFKILYRNFQCDQCNKWFATESILGMHVKKIHSKTATLCEICGVSFILIKKHMETHLKTFKKNFKCADCGLAFREKSHLEVHMRKHTGERPFKCKECGNRFKTVGHLINHRETHKPYSERCRVVRRNRPASRVPKN